MFKNLLAQIHMVLLSMEKIAVKSTYRKSLNFVHFTKQPTCFFLSMSKLTKKLQVFQFQIYWLIIVLSLKPAVFFFFELTYLIAYIYSKKKNTGVNEQMFVRILHCTVTVSTSLPPHYLLRYRNSFKLSIIYSKFYYCTCSFQYSGF